MFPFLFRAMRGSPHHCVEMSKIWRLSNLKIQFEIKMPIHLIRFNGNGFNENITSKNYSLEISFLFFHVVNIIKILSDSISFYRFLNDCNILDIFWVMMFSFFESIIKIKIMGWYGMLSCMLATYNMFFINLCYHTHKNTTK